MTQSRNDADVAFIKALAELLNDNDLSELSVKRDYGENDSLNVKVSKLSAQSFVQHVASAHGGHGLSGGRAGGREFCKPGSASV
jgi:hypothetical protein